MIHDLAQDIKIANTILPQAFTNSDTATGSTVNITGFRSAVFAVELGALSASGISITLQGQDEDGDWEDIDNGDLISDSDITDLDEIAAADDEVIHKFGLATANYQALRANVDADTASGAGELAVSIVAGNYFDEPV